MADAVTPPSNRRVLGLYFLLILVVGSMTFGVIALLMNIQKRQTEGEQYYFKTVDLTEDTIDPAEWGKNFPRQYDSYKRTVDTERTHYGGSEDIPRDKLTEDPRLRRIFAGYGFAIEYTEERGHAYMLLDQKNTRRVKDLKQPGACVHCHASVLPAYKKAGNGDIMKGFALVNAMPINEAHQLVQHPVSCIDCHDPSNVQLRVTRPGFLNGIKEFARSDNPVPHLPSIERWRKGDRKKDYDPNELASRQEMRSFVCGQCHVEYYFKGEQKMLTYPWHRGLRAEQIEEYYDKDTGGFKDWIHKESKAPVLKAQHPEFEMWNQGIHARSNVSCADCHMPYLREGAVKISDHQVRSPMLQINRACQTCHRFPEAELQARVDIIQDRTKAMLERGEQAVVDLIDALQAAEKSGVKNESLHAARALQRKAQWRIDFVNAENSMGFHAPQETARILAEGIDYARQGQILLLRPAAK